jgi:hypothetical protein
MIYRTFIAFLLLLPAIGTSGAQQASDKIDLGRFTDVPTGVIGIGASFESTSAMCPEDQALFRIARGALMQFRTSTEAPRQQYMDVQNTATDDYTHSGQYRVFECRVDLLVGMQGLIDGSWVPILLPKTRRPNRSAEERKQAVDELMAQARTQLEQMSPEERKERSDRFREQQATGWSIGRLPTTSAGVGFEASGDCFEAVGTFALDQSGIRFLFPTNMPGGVNQFTIERADVDLNRARFYFVRDKCRLEIEISRSVLRGGQWHAVPLAVPRAPIQPPPFRQ